MCQDWGLDLRLEGSQTDDMIGILGNTSIHSNLKTTQRWKEKQMCSNKSRCDNFCYCYSHLFRMSELISNAKTSTKTKQSPKTRVVVVSVPMYQVFQPLPLFFILFQLFPPRLPFLHSHSLEEPSLTHGFGLRREQRHVRCLEREFRWCYIFWSCF